MHYMRSMAYMQWQTHPAGAVRLDFQFNNDMTHQTTRWHDYTMPCLTRRWHASLTHVHDAMPLTDHNDMRHWHTIAMHDYHACRRLAHMPAMHVPPMHMPAMHVQATCTCLLCMSQPHAHVIDCHACPAHMPRYPAVVRGDEGEGGRGRLGG